MSLHTPQLLVNVPALDPRTAPGLPAGVRYFDPGLPGGANSAQKFTPQTLPMDSAKVRALLAQFAQLARECKNPGELTAFMPGYAEDFYSGTRMAIQSELSARRTEDGAHKRLAEALTRAQTQLCLAWALEDAAQELSGLENRLGGQWADFEKSLGLNEDAEADSEDTALARNRPVLAPGLPRVPARSLVEAVLAFLPDGAGLYTAEESLIADWSEFGVTFGPAQAPLLERLGLSGHCRRGVAPGWQLSLLRKPDAARPWLDQQRLVIAATKE